MDFFKLRLIRILMAVFLFLIAACSGDNGEIKPENRIIRLIGPVAYKGIDGQMVVEGIVLNNTDKSLENIMVVVSWYNRDKDFLFKWKKKLEVLSAHGTANYRIEGEFDPRMAGYGLMFYNQRKELLSTYYLKYSGP